jgi:hypothetical protein
MSMRNQRTGRHEDDLMDEAARNAGYVTAQSLIEHLEEIVGDAPTFGSNVSNAAKAAARLLRDCEMLHPHDLNLAKLKVRYREDVVV